MTISRYHIDGHPDLLVCIDCGQTRSVPRHQTIVLSARQSGHQCGNPDWPLPAYTPPRQSRRTTRQPQETTT